MNLQGQSALLAAILILAAGTAVALSKQKPKAWLRFSLLNFNLFLWQACVFMKGVSSWQWWARLALASAALIPATSLAFFDSLLETGGKVTSRLLAFATFTGIGLASIAFTPLGGGELYRCLVGFFVFPALYACTGIAWYKRRSSSSNLNRTRLLYLFGGGVVVVSLNLMDVLASAGIAVPPLGSVAVLVYVYFLSQLLFKYRLVDVQDLVAKGAVVGLLALLLTAVFSILTVWVGGHRPGLFFFNALVASVVILLLFDPMKTVVEERAKRLFFQRSKELTSTALKLKNELARALEPDEIATMLVKGLSRLKRVAAVSVYFLDQDSMALERRAFIGKRPAKRIDLRHHKALADELQKGKRYIYRDLVAGLPGGRGNAGDHRSQRLLRSLDDLCCSLCVPIRTGDVVVGLLNLGDETSFDPYTEEDMYALLDLADRAAVAYETSRLFQAREERARLASLGEMAASLAHEIRNPLGAIKGAAQFLAGSAQGRDKEFLDIILEETNRLNGVVERFLDYARPFSLKRERLDVNEAVRQAAAVASAAAPDDVDVEMDLDPSLPLVEADKDGIHQVLLNLLRNAFEAVDGQGKIHVKTRRPRRRQALLKVMRPDKEHGQWVEIIVRDSGPGIPAKARDRIFSPFYTTKERGTGLGLSISKRIVEAHGGRLVLRSGKGRRTGAVFSVSLPVDAKHGHGMLQKPRIEES